MTDTDWHAPPALLTRFADDPRTLDDMTASSIEAHLVACEACRATLSTTADTSLVAMSWDRIADQIDRPRATLVERILHRLGVSSAFARLLGATPALQAAGLTAVAVLAAAAAAVSRSADAEGPFLVLAPLAPLAAVAASFVPAAEPAGEAGVGTPMHGVGLVVRRSIAILSVSFGLLTIGALALPNLGLAAAAWVLPALALSLGALALGTWMRIEVAVVFLAGGWLIALWTAMWFAGREVAVADSATFTVAGQLAALFVAAASTTVLFARRDRFATLEAFR